MLHNETINVWTHLIGMIIFLYVIGHTYNTYQPSEFYYKVHQERQVEFGVPANNIEQASSQNELWEQWSYLGKLP